METNINKWKVNRAGLFNYWYYEDEIFDFAGGKLLLRGNNGAGKSVTMQSFLPVLLDGSTRPERLDPFGSNARRMEDYLLGEKEISNLDERTGYLYMEFKRKHTDQYITIGIGLKARRGSPLDFWGFVITDNRRIGKDFLLYKEDTHEGETIKIPLSKIQIRNQIEDGGQVVDRKNEYAALVNQYIFGYESIEEYEDLIKLLIQLRSPKLSKEFRPTAIYEILEGALPPLSDDDLRYLSDTIEQMDQTKQQLQQLNQESDAVSEINRVYTLYNNKVLFDQAEGYLEALKALEKEGNIHETKIKQKQNFLQTIDQLKTDIHDNTIDREATEKLRQRLEQHEVWNLEQEQQDKLTTCKTEEDRLSQTVSRLDDLRQKEYAAHQSFDTIELTIQKNNKLIEDILEDLASDAIESSFEDTHTSHTEDFILHKEEQFEFNAWTLNVSQHLNHLGSIIEELRELERLKKNYIEKDRELGQVSQEVDILKRDKTEWENSFDEEKSSQLNKIHKWIEEGHYLSITDETIQEISRALNHLYDRTRYDQIREPVREVVSDFEAKLRGQIAEVIVEKNGVNETINQLKEDLSIWSNKKDPDPNTHPLTKEARNELVDKGVHAVPLYNTVEFREDVSEDTQKRIEAALLESGLLDALITDKAVEVEHDRILRPNPQLMAYTLADILKPDLDSNHHISDKLVDQVLSSILIDESENQILSISEKGYYSIGLMKGHAVPIDSVKYIGRHARKRYREEQIDIIKDAILKEESKLEGLINKENQMNQTINKSKEHFERFPDDIDLSEGFKALERVRINLEQLNIRVTGLSEEVKQIGRLINEIKISIERENRKYDLKLDLAVFLEAIENMRRYEKTLGELRHLHLQILNDIRRKKEIMERLEEYDIDIIELKGDASVYQTSIDRLKKEIEQINRQIENEGIKDIRQQIKEVQNRLLELNKNLEVKRDERASKIKDLEYTEQAIEESVTKLSFYEKIKQAWEISFLEELKLDFSSIELNGLSKKEKADKIITYYSQLSHQVASHLVARLSRIRNDQQDYLIEYSPSQRTVRNEVPEWMETSEIDSFRPNISAWKSANSRDLIDLMHHGKKVSPYVVEADLTEDKERQKVYLDEQDKQLYEEILFHSVGNKLRARINRAERWVEEMENLMETRKDSSGLMFSVKWKPRTAETEEELDTKDLVDLLRQNARFLNEEDIDRVTTHFRTKIERAKTVMDNSTEMQTLLQVLKQVLDYRRWFSFELSYQRTGDDRKRPLTNQQFYKFSGGEKARAMYIPLFIATYSRYLEAKKDAPYLISLDEAFAGVDDQNISDLFEVIEELDFNYIINSQALWGDYETVSELAISELFRPQNADHVAVIRYLWDGHKRSLLTESEE